MISGLIIESSPGQADYLMEKAKTFHKDIVFIDKNNFEEAIRDFEQVFFDIIFIFYPRQDTSDWRKICKFFKINVRLPCIFIVEDESDFLTNECLRSFSYITNTEIDSHLFNEKIQLELLKITLDKTREWYNILQETSEEIYIFEQKHYNIVYANRALITNIGYPERILLSMRAYDLQYPVDKNKFVENLQALLENKSSEIRLDTYRYCFEGKKYPIEETYKQFYWADKKAILVFAHNITNRLEQENKIKQMLDREKELNQMKSDFIYMVSHEYRTPLTSITNSINLIEQYETRITPEQKTKYFGYIKNSIHTLANMMNDVVLLNRIKEKKLRFQPQKIIPLQIIEEICQQLEYDYERKIQIYSSANQKEYALLDENMFRNILHNLLQNAIKYSPGGEPITIHIDFTKEKSVLQLKISDKGIGIAPQDQEKLFEAFFRGENIGNISGTGLGLSIVQDAVAAHNGIIQVKSNKNEGTTFTVEIPLSGD